MASKYRTVMTSVAGHEPSKICQGTVTNVNLVKWTVDVRSQFDRKTYLNVQVCSPYLHHSNGEGIYVMPEVGAQVMMCMPSDSNAPFVLAFIMVTEVTDPSAPDAPLGTTQHSQPPANANDNTFAGGRPIAQPGDIVMRTRDENFVILHRGGVLQIGATALSQRIFIPLNNLIMDISENYEHDNAGGTIKWGIQEGPSTGTYPTTYFQTFRVFASDQYADVKISCGDILSPVGEPDGGVALAAAGVGQGNDPKTASNCILFEVAVSPGGSTTASGGFVGNTGVPNTGAVAASVMKFTFDRKGNTLYRTEGNFSWMITKTLTLAVQGDMNATFGGAASMKATKGFTIDGGPATNINGTVVKLANGKNPVARQGDFVTILLTPQSPPLMVGIPIPVNTPTGPGSIVPPTPISLIGVLTGQITSGNPAVLA